MMSNNNKRISEKVFTEYKQKVYGYLIKKKIPIHDRDDVFSDIMMKILNYEKEYDETKSSISTWVYIITKSVVADYYIKKNKENIMLQTYDSINLKASSINYEKELSQLANNLAKLLEKDRQIILLRVYQKKEYHEIAQQLNITEVNARVSYHRAIKKLKQVYDNE